MLGHERVLETFLFWQFVCCGLETNFPRIIIVNLALLVFFFLKEKHKWLCTRNGPFPTSAGIKLFEGSV